MSPQILNVVANIATLAGTPWRKRKVPALQQVIDQLTDVADRLAPAAVIQDPADIQDFNQNLELLASAIEELDGIRDQLQEPDSPEETTQAVENLDDNLSTVLELLWKLSTLGHIIETTDDELRDKWLPRVREIPTLPASQREAAVGALLLAPLTARESQVIRQLIREVTEQRFNEDGDKR